jgi:uncharacterized membrane protein
VADVPLGVSTAEIITTGNAFIFVVDTANIAPPIIVQDNPADDELIAAMGAETGLLITD